MKIQMIMATLALATSLQAKIVKEAFYVFDSNGRHIQNIETTGSLTIDHRDPIGYELYGPEGTKDWLEQQNLAYFHLKKVDQKLAGDYPTPEEIEQKLQLLAQTYPHLLQLSSIGQSVQGRSLWMAKISDNPTRDEVEPEFKYVANMHGDEIVGRELMVMLLEDLLVRYANGDQSVVDLVNNTEIYIIPSMNPDGAAKPGRGNANWVDLNRDFPDFTTSDNTNNPQGREPETQALMALSARRNFALSANFHGGAVVMNYPWDTSHEEFPEKRLIFDLCTEYANLVDEMRESNSFPGGVTNGYDWYEVNGGMQDWSYHWHHDLQVTVEVSDIKWPSYTTVAGHYKAHKTSLYNYIKAVHQGIGFQFKDDIAKSFKVTFKSQQETYGPYSSFNTEFYKVLPTGDYMVTVEISEKQSYQFHRKVESSISRNGNFEQL